MVTTRSRSRRTRTTRLYRSRGGAHMARASVSRRRRGRRGRQSTTMRRQRGGKAPVQLVGACSDFSPDMTTRTFGAKQPFWTPNVL